MLLLTTFVPLGGLFGVYLWGCLADRYGRKSSLLISNGISVFSSAIMCLDKIFLRLEFTLFARFFAGMTTDFSFLVSIIAVFAIISSILLVPSLESPRFLYLQRNEEEKARQALMKLRGEEDVEEEMEELRQEQLAESDQENMTVWKLLCFHSLQRHLVILTVLVSGSQFVQTNAILIFAQLTYKYLGLSAETMRLLPLVGCLIIQLMILTTICTVEPLGRKFLFLSGFMFCIISNIALVFTFQSDRPELALISIVLIILYFLGYIMGPASIVPVIIGELFLQSSRASAFVIAGFISSGIHLFSTLLFFLTKSYLDTYHLLLSWPFMILAFIYIFRVVPETSGKTFEEIQKNMVVCTFKNSGKVTPE
ncbi:solute carrier family 2, facilitated glucose transporter member 7-like isoform X2 [Erythrolamprus reginae]|uniref:solute carrier family 2, facilitated glucose transporter member 7-like isoform X2 n=1 Tax=Erythrolamprus reginae TaxID=121349 RepID=UPI00396CC40C